MGRPVTHFVLQVVHELVADVLGAVALVYRGAATHVIPGVVHPGVEGDRVETVERQVGEELIAQAAGAVNVAEGQPKGVLGHFEVAAGAAAANELDAAVDELAATLASKSPLDRQVPASSNDSASKLSVSPTESGNRIGGLTRWLYSREEFPVQPGPSFPLETHMLLGRAMPRHVN